jgi:hypothetical protein
MILAAGPTIPIAMPLLAYQGGLHSDPVVLALAIVLIIAELVLPASTRHIKAVCERAPAWARLHGPLK